MSYFKLLENEFKTTHRFIFHSILYEYIANKNRSTNDNILLNLSSRIIGGVIGMYIFTYTEKNKTLYWLLVAFSFIIYINYYNRK